MEAMRGSLGSRDRAPALIVPRVDRARRRRRSRAGPCRAAGGEARGREGRDGSIDLRWRGGARREALGAATPRRRGGWTRERVRGSDAPGSPASIAAASTRRRLRRAGGAAAGRGAGRADGDAAGTDQRSTSRSGLRDVPGRRRAQSRRLRRRRGRRLRSDNRPDRGRRRPTSSIPTSARTRTTGSPTSSCPPTNPPFRSVSAPMATRATPAPTRFRRAGRSRAVRRSDGDRHVLVVRRPQSPGGACAALRALPGRERGGTRGAWSGDSGAIFDLGATLAGQRPDGWTSADAAGLPIYPGLVTYEEVATGEIDHAIRVTFEQTRRGYVSPATHYAIRLMHRSGRRWGCGSGSAPATTSPR